MKLLRLAVVPLPLALVALGLAQHSPPSPTPSPPAVVPAAPSVAVAQQVAPAPAAHDIPQWHGQYRGTPELTTQVLRSARSWSDFWRQVGEKPPQNLNEEMEMAVEVCAGERPTGGYVVRILTASVEHDSLVIVYAVQAPAPSSFVTQVVTAPWAVGIVPRSDRDVIFKQNTE